MVSDALEWNVLNKTVINHAKEMTIKPPTYFYSHTIVILQLSPSLKTHGLLYKVLMHATYHVNKSHEAAFSYK